MEAGWLLRVTRYFGLGRLVRADYKWKRVWSSPANRYVVIGGWPVPKTKTVECGWKIVLLFLGLVYPLMWRR